MINLTQNLTFRRFCPDISDDEGLVIFTRRRAWDYRHTGAHSELRDYEAYGRDVRISEAASSLGGYVSAVRRLKEYYHEPQDIPAGTPDICLS